MSYELPLIRLHLYQAKDVFGLAHQFSYVLNSGITRFVIIQLVPMQLMHAFSGSAACGALAVTIWTLKVLPVLMIYGNGVTYLRIVSS